MKILNHSVAKYTALAAFTMASVSLGASKYHNDQLHHNKQRVEEYNHIQRKLDEVNYALAQPLLMPDRQQTLKDIKEAYLDLKGDIYEDYGVYDKDSLEKAIQENSAEHNKKGFKAVGTSALALMFGLGTLGYTRRQRRK